MHTALDPSKAPAPETPQPPPPKCAAFTRLPIAFPPQGRMDKARNGKAPSRTLHPPVGNKERAKEKDLRKDSFSEKAGRKTRDRLRVGASDVCAVRCVGLEQRPPGLRTPSSGPEWLIQSRYSTTDLGLISAHARVPL